LVYPMNEDRCTTVEENLFKVMTRIRMVEEAIADRYSEQQMRCPVHLSIGQEAPSAAFSLIAEDGDYAVSTHRAHAHFLAKGGSLSALISEIYGKTTGCSRGAGGSMHLADRSIGFMGSSAIVGNSIPVGVGLGLALKRQAREQVSWVFIGDAATEEGVYYESVNFAVLHSLPVVFVCENNGYSVYSDASVRRPKMQTIAAVASALGCQARTAEGADALECWEAFKWAREQAQAGPILLEVNTFRHREHCGPNFDDSLGYRPQDYVEKGLSEDPISVLQSRLKSSGRLGWVSEYEALVRKEIDVAFVAAEEAEFLTLEQARGFVYAD